jgi:hypothetical protein
VTEVEEMSEQQRVSGGMGQALKEWADRLAFGKERLVWEVAKGASFEEAWAKLKAARLAEPTSPAPKGANSSEEESNDD